MVYDYSQEKQSLVRLPKLEFGEEGKA